MILKLYFNTRKIFMKYWEIVTERDWTGSALFTCESQYFEDKITQFTSFKHSISNNKHVPSCNYQQRAFILR